MTAPSTRLLGTALVALQFALIAALVAHALPALRAAAIPAGGWLCALAGALLAGAAVSYNRPGNFNIRPEPRAGGRLVREGPYRFVRHPMYTSVLLFGVAAAWSAGRALAWLEVALLAAVLAAKATIEERAMLAAHPDYAAYRARTRRFVPWVF
jgi:protein-S-isoprenylcysteine O-methyltransferase Ste14